MNSTEKRLAATSPGRTTRNATSPRNTMPAPPPRAAMSSISSSVAAPPEESHESGGAGGAPLSDRKDKDHHNHHHATSHATSSSNLSSNLSPRDSAKDSKDRDRQRDRRDRRERDREVETLLREKDEHIADLEQDRTTMEQEFQTLLDRLSKNESETATFWQSKYSVLHQQFLRTDTDLRLIRNELDVCMVEREEMRDEKEILRLKLQERDEEIRALRGQVRGLKEWVSTSTRTDDQTSDEVFGDGMTRLGNGLQNWVIVNFRKAKLDIAGLDEATLAEISELVPMYEELASTAKVHLLQSVVSRILVEMIFGAYYVGLSNEQTEHFCAVEKLLSSFTNSDEPINHWRAATLTLLRREAPSHFDTATATLATTVIDRINRLLTSLTCPTTSPSESRDSALRVLVNNSIDLARLLVVQKAALKVFMPAILPIQRVLFEAETMEDIGGEDEEALEQREICCVAFPGVVKFGDENGGQMQFKNVLAKARVLCSPE